MLCLLSWVVVKSESRHLRDTQIVAWIALVHNWRLVSNMHVLGVWRWSGCGRGARARGAPAPTRPGNAFAATARAGRRAHHHRGWLPPRAGLQDGEAARRWRVRRT